MVLGKAALLSFGSFFFNDTATTEIYTLSLHDALPICHAAGSCKLLRELRLNRCLVHGRSEEHTSELQSHVNLVCRLLIEKKKSHLGNHSVVAARVQGNRPDSPNPMS